MNETIALRPDSRASAKDSVVDYTLASLEELEQLHPALNLLAHPSIAQVAMIFLSVAMTLAYGMRRPGPLKRWRLYLIR